MLENCGGEEDRVCLAEVEKRSATLDTNRGEILGERLELYASIVALHFEHHMCQLSS